MAFLQHEAFKTSSRSKSTSTTLYNTANGLDFARTNTQRKNDELIRYSSRKGTSTMYDRLQIDRIGRQRKHNQDR